MNSATIDYRFENNISRISSVYLRVLVSSVGGCTHAIPSMFLNNIQIFASNGSKLLYHSVSNIENEWVNNTFMSYIEHTTTAAIRGTDENYTTNEIVMPAATQRYFYIPIALNFWRSLHLRPYSFDGNLLVRLKFNALASNISAGTLQSTEAQLILSGYNEPSHQESYNLSRATVPKQLGFYGIQRHYETQTLSAGAKYQVRLSGITGHCNVLIFGLRAIADIASPSSQYSFQRCASFDILNSSNKSITGYKSQIEEDMILMYSYVFPNKYVNYTGAQFWSFSQSPMADVSTGSCNGSYHFTGFEVLEFTTKSSLVPGSYQLFVMCLSSESLNVDNAQLSTTRS